MRSLQRSIVVAAALVAAGCGSSGLGVTTTLPDPTTTISTVPQITTTTSVVEATSTTLESSSTTVAGVPGTPIDFGPTAGDVLMVIGVSHDDALNLRSGPGTDQEIIDRIDPTEMGLVAQGNTRQLDNSLWIEVDHDGSVGWVHMGFIGYAGSTEDQTAAVVAELGGSIPTAGSMVALGQVVADTYDSDDEPVPDIVRVTSVASGDLAEVSFDVVGLGDDAVRGVRLHIFGEAVQGGFTLKSVEVLIICGRGVDDDGLCV